MTIPFANTMRALVYALSVIVGACTIAWAGASMLDDIDDDTDSGTIFVGFVRDVAGGFLVKDAKVTAELKNPSTSLVTHTDTLGHFKFVGFAKDIDPSQVEITCSKDGYRLDKAVKHRSSAEAPVEVDCLLVHQ